MTIAKNKNIKNIKVRDLKPKKDAKGGSTAPLPVPAFDVSEGKKGPNAVNVKLA